MLYVPLLIVVWIPWPMNDKLGMIIYFRVVGEILDSPSPGMCLQDAEMMNLDLD